MKTDLTELLEDLNAMKNSEVLGIAKDAIHECIITATSYLETEKQQHEKIAIDMVNIALDNLNNPNVKMEDEYNKYYNETYGNNQ